MKCPKCKKPNSEFYFNQKHCKECQKKMSANWRKKNKQRVIKKGIEYSIKNNQMLNKKFRDRYRKKNKVKKDNYRVDEEGNKIYRIKVKKFRRHKTRFAVLKRDNFTCQYCGRKAPEVILEVDHIYPKSKGGLNKLKNYKTACKDCNIGKGVDILEVI